MGWLELIQVRLEQNLVENEFLVSVGYYSAPSQELPRPTSLGHLTAPMYRWQIWGRWGPCLTLSSTWHRAEQTTDLIRHRQMDNEYSQGSILNVVDKRPIVSVGRVVREAGCREALGAISNAVPAHHFRLLSPVFYGCVQLCSFYSTFYYESFQSFSKVERYHLIF